MTWAVVELKVQNGVESVRHKIRGRFFEHHAQAGKNGDRAAQPVQEDRIHAGAVVIQRMGSAVEPSACKANDKAKDGTDQGIAKSVKQLQRDLQFEQYL